MSPILVFLVLIFAKGKAQNNVANDTIESKVKKYFDGGEFDTFKKTWDTLRPSYENAISLTLKETFGTSAGSMNLYVSRDRNTLYLGSGYLFTDNVVHVVLKELYLHELPRLYSPDVSFPFHHNVIRVESMVSKLFVDASYYLFRKKANTYEDPNKIKDKSPFSYKRVATDGILTIIGEDCHMVGQAVVTLSGLTVHTGHTTFRVKNCRFSVEIPGTNDNDPPTIAPYFSKEQSRELERLISTALNEEMHIDLEGILFSHINTTAFFGETMPKIRRKQGYMFQDTSDYLSRVAAHMNIQQLEKNFGILKIKDRSFSWDQALTTRQDEKATVKLSDMTINGLDRLYYANRGGPIVTGYYQILDEFRYERLQVRGKLTYKVDGKNEATFNFSVEVHDVALSVKIQLKIPLEPKETLRSGRREADSTESIAYHKLATIYDDTDSSGVDDQKLYAKKLKSRSDSDRNVRAFNVTGWRLLEFSSNPDDEIKSHLDVYSLIAGYLVTEIPETLEKNLIADFKNVVNKADEQEKLEKQGKAKRHKKKKINRLVLLEKKRNISKLKKHTVKIPNTTWRDRTTSTSPWRVFSKTA